MNKLNLYKYTIKSLYTRGSSTLELAKATIHPRFDETEIENRDTFQYCLDEYSDRFECEPKTIADWGCGIGRLMKPYSEAGMMIDGFDVSSNMLGFAQERFPGSNFYEVEPDGTLSETSHNQRIEYDYDLIYSFLVLQHNCNRYLRLHNLENIERLLSNKGLVIIQMVFQPNYNDVNDLHHKYNENAVSNTTNSLADCVITKDTLGDVYQDFSLFFANVKFEFLPNISVDKFYHNHIIISAIKS